LFLSSGNRSCAMNDHRPKIGATAFTYAKQANPTAGATLSWHNTDPCGELTSRSELSCITDRGNDRRSSEWADAWDGPQPTASIVATFVDLQLPLNRLDAPAQIVNQLQLAAERIQHQRRYAFLDRRERSR